MRSAATPDGWMMDGRMIMRSKYGAKKIAFEGETFDSKAELRRWLVLQLMERAGEITGLLRQVKYELIPAQRDDYGNVLERAVNYVADFQYIDRRTHTVVVEDVKGVRTKDYIIKRKLMLWIHKIRISEVE